MWMCWCVLVWNGHVKWEDHSKPRQPIAKSFCPIDSIVQVSNPMVLIKAWQSNILRCSLAWFCEMAIQQKRNYPPFPPASLAPLLYLSLSRCHRSLWCYRLSFSLLSLLSFALYKSLRWDGERLREWESLGGGSCFDQPASQPASSFDTVRGKARFRSCGRHHQMNPQRYTSQQILLPPCLPPTKLAARTAAANNY